MSTPEKEPLLEGKSPSDGCGECEIDYVRHGAIEMQAFQTKQNNDLRAELASIREERDAYRAMLQIFSDAKDESVIRRAWIEIETLLAKYPSPTNTD